MPEDFDDPAGRAIYELVSAITSVFEAYAEGYGAELRADWPTKELRELDRLRGVIEVPFAMEAAE